MVLLGAGLFAFAADEKTASPGSGEKSKTGALKDNVHKLIESARTKFDVPATGAPTERTPFAPDPSKGLPPRQIAWY